jgi:hypothetical protein
MSAEIRVLTVEEIAEILGGFDVTEQWTNLESAWRLRAPIEWAALDAAP